MNTKYIMELPCTLIEKTGVSKKTGKNYRILALEITTKYGNVEVVLNTNTDKAGFVLDMLSREEG